VATSASNPAVQAAASASVTIAPNAGLAAELSPGVQVLPVPGTTSFLLEVSNTGNTGDAYTATITATSGPVAASLVGLDGSPTRSIPLFRLPGLSTGAIVINTDLMAPGQGTFTVQVQSQNHPSMSASATAQVSTATPNPTPTPATPTPSPTSTSTQTGPPPAPRTSPVTVTAFRDQKYRLIMNHHVKRAIVLFVQFSGALDANAAQNLGAYRALGGKMKKVHKVSQVIYNKPIPLLQAIYASSGDTVILIPKTSAKLPKLEQLQMNVSILKDAMEVPINNGQSFAATLTRSGFILSTIGVTPSIATSPAAAAIDALFEHGLVPSVRDAGKRLNLLAR
jgi:hypothetical protein